jgi:type I restriction enzyme S subunit
MEEIKKGFKKTKIGLIPKDWEVKRLGDLIDGKITNGYSPVTSNKKTGKWILTLSALTGDNIDFKERKSAPLDNKKLNNYELQKGDFLISRSNTPNRVGFSALVKKEIKDYFYPDLMIKFRINNKKIFSYYLEYFLKSSSVMKYFKLYASGTSSSMVKINQKVIKNLLIPLPPLKEHEKIAKILSTWDRAIEKQEELIKAKERLKKGLMQKLLTGKVRFKGFNEEWKEVRLGEIVEYKNGGSFEKKIEKDGRYYLITLNSIDIHGNMKIIEKKVNLKSNFLLNKNDLIMILSDVAHGNFLGLTNIIPENNKYVLNQRVGALKPKNINSIFLSKILNMNQRYFKTHGQGSSQKNLSKGDILKFKLKLPPLEEQQKIAKVLSTADREIELLKNELELLKKQKKGLMQKLLTGKVRVKIDGNETLVS